MSIRKLVNFLYFCRVCKPKKNMSIISYLKFLIRSTNQHGVHSPFVYNFVTRCLYNKQLVSTKELSNCLSVISKKQLISLLKIIRYLGVNTIFTDEKKLSIKENCSLVTELQPATTYDLLFINDLKADCDFYLDFMYNDSILVVNNIHQEKNKLLWRKLIDNEKVTACIDVYYQGYIFIRREQLKEVFYIR